MLRGKSEYVGAKFSSEIGVDLLFLIFLPPLLLLLLLLLLEDEGADMLMMVLLDAYNTSFEPFVLRPFKPLCTSTFPGPYKLMRVLYDAF